MLTGSLPSQWPRLAESRLDDMSLTGRLPPAGQEWGKNTSNSIQKSVVNNCLHGQVPQQWVQQFCLAVVQDSGEQVLFEPSSIEVSKGNSDPNNITIPAGSPITLLARHASINVTLDRKLYVFSYQDPRSICSIPNAVRNMALPWGIFFSLLLAMTIGTHLWLRRKPSLVPPRILSKLTVLSSASRNQKVQLPKRVVTWIWVLASDVVWYIYSQVADAIAIQQVFDFGHRGIAFALLAVLLLPYFLVFLLVMRACVKHYQSKFGRRNVGRFQGWARSATAVMTGLVVSPILLLALQATMLLEVVGIAGLKRVLPADCKPSILYRAKSLAEPFGNALPQSIIKTKLYIMGNDPNGIRVYIDTSLFLASVSGSCVSMLKSIALLMIEVHQYQYSFIGFLKRLVDLAPFDNYPGLQSAGSI